MGLNAERLKIHCDGSRKFDHGFRVEIGCPSPQAVIRPLDRNVGEDRDCVSPLDDIAGKRKGGGKG
ncbi:hypothetical protein AGR7A_Lc120541 [Agrobacterium deltaense NCPPB 1641]|uniref:Uncharacterized protein n=1 Tax=Agrobacterium deltaense NCPPB 1641 TaxID=1183425 RepID=A0A1S7TXZ3_9HYPH|nr:hypothetical protein AGR7A_Lc120541 [Agrobacterium deltaense NCPPB 1641]